MGLVKRLFLEPCCFPKPLHSPCCYIKLDLAILGELFDFLGFGVFWSCWLFFVFVFYWLDLGRFVLVLLFGWFFLT